MSRAEAAAGVRLQRVLAAAGVGSRRHCEELIAAGRVSVDGTPVTRQGLRVDPDRVVIRVDGDRLATRGDATYLALNKPRGLLTTMHDDRGRPCLGDLLAGRRVRLFPVGRLDADSEGLLLVTNDGELAHRLAHPAYEVPKTYLAEVRGPLTRGALAALRSGVVLDGEPVTVEKAAVTGSVADRLLLTITVHEGRKHLVRRLLAGVGHPVLRLARESIGPVRLGGLRPGSLRPLTAQEIAELYALVDL